VCSGCQDGGSPYDQEQTFGSLSPFSAPIFGAQGPVRRSTYRTSGAMAPKTGGRSESVARRNWPAEANAIYTCVYYGRGDSVADERDVPVHVMNNSQRVPSDVLVSRHTIVELYRGYVSRNGDVHRDVRDAGSDWRSVSQRLLRKTLLVSFWLLAGYGAWSAVERALVAATAPRGIVRAKSSELHRDGIGGNR
jgi:hypothetical protein